MCSIFAPTITKVFFLHARICVQRGQAQSHCYFIDSILFKSLFRNTNCRGYYRGITYQTTQPVSDDLSMMRWRLVWCVQVQEVMYCSQTCWQKLFLSKILSLSTCRLSVVFQLFYFTILLRVRNEVHPIVFVPFIL